jgi:HSP20 family protein
MFGRNLPMRGSDDMFPSLRDVDRMFDTFGSSMLRPFGDLGALDKNFIPALDVRENDDSIEVSCELPGISEKDVEVGIERNILTIHGEKKNEWTSNEKGVHRSERRFGSFTRSIQLPDGVDEDKAEATFKNGMLHITVPKGADYQKRHRTIQIKREQDNK